MYGARWMVHGARCFHLFFVVLSMVWHTMVCCDTVEKMFGNYGRVFWCKGCGVVRPHIITILRVWSSMICCVVWYGWMWCVCPHVITIFMTRAGIKRWQKPVPPANTGLIPRSQHGPSAPHWLALIPRQGTHTNLPNPRYPQYGFQDIRIYKGIYYLYYLNKHCRQLQFTVSIKIPV